MAKKRSFHLILYSTCTSSRYFLNSNKKLAIIERTGGRTMKRYLKSQQYSIIVLLVILAAIFFGGCANVQHQASFTKNYLPGEDVRIQVAEVVNDTGLSFDIDIEKMLSDNLEEQLHEENLLCLGELEPNLFLESRIIGYKKGSAFKRWMMPGWGATELSIHCNLKDGKNNLVGSAVASREIFAGGLYTVGAWETIFKEVANDVAEDLRNQCEARGYVVQPKSRLQKTATAESVEQKKQVLESSREDLRVASIPKEAAIVRVSLRRQPMTISSPMQITRMLVQYNFFEITRNAQGSFANDFADNNDGTVTDQATGLMWQKSGSPGTLDNRGAKRYVQQLNDQQFAGYANWRMPTLEELASLLARNPDRGSYIDSVFDIQQTSCWTVDSSDYPSSAWIVSFKNGEVTEARWRSSPAGGSLAPGSMGSVHKNTINHVKAVRTVK